MKQARLLLQAEELEASIAFYRDLLGWRVNRQEGGIAAWMAVDEQNSAVLLAADQVELPEPLRGEWMLPHYSAPQRGNLVYQMTSSVDETEKHFRGSGLRMTRHEEPGHTRALHVSAIDGYTLVYWEELHPADEEIVRMYEDGIEALEKAVAGLSEEQLDLSEMQGKWSIREQVLHVIDLELVTLHKVKFALAEPGRFYQGNAFQADSWHAGLAYARRSIANELGLFRAARQHLLGLCRELPDALARTIWTERREERVAGLLKMMAGHANHHIRAVQRIRDRHGV
ncbi:DinB family protein [Paenibacillus oryzisoli]|uniref:DinB family protein n=1 Tax=Paenibacillus oryzisoli TaxID=1850517 RepID=UPI003D2C5F59